MMVFSLSVSLCAVPVGVGDHDPPRYPVRTFHNQVDLFISVELL